MKDPENTQKTTPNTLIEVEEIWKPIITGLRKIM